MTLRTMLVAGALLWAPVASTAATFAPPRLAIEGTTDGTATLSTAVGITLPVERVDLTPWITFETSSTDGLATLLSLQQAKDGTRDTAPHPWTMGGTLTIRWWGPTPPEIPGAERAAALASAYAVCSAQCRGVMPADDEGKFCDRRKQLVDEAARDWLAARVANRPPPDAYCEGQRKAIEALEEAVEQGLVAADVARRRRMDAFGACMAPCAPDSAAPAGERTFCGILEGLPYEVAPAIVGADRFCKAGQQVLASLEKRHPETIGRERRLLVNVGGQSGRATYEHLAPDAANPGLLAPKETSTHPWSLGASGAWLFRPGGVTETVEALVTYQRTFARSEDRARYCVPAGDVSQPGGGSTPATVCHELDMAAPVGSHDLRAALLLGVFDQVESRWRAAIGADVVRRGSDGRWRTTVELPIQFAVAGSSSYKGLVRLVPSVAFGGDPGEGTVVAVSLALLGQRGFFSEKFDRL